MFECSSPNSLTSPHWEVCETLPNHTALTSKSDSDLNFSQALFFRSSHIYFNFLCVCSQEHHDWLRGKLVSKSAFVSPFNQLLCLFPRPSDGRLLSFPSNVTIRKQLVCFKRTQAESLFILVFSSFRCRLLSFVATFPCERKCLQRK